jgi:hypothetical protein
LIGVDWKLEHDISIIVVVSDNKNYVGLAMSNAFFQLGEIDAGAPVGPDS